MEKEESQAVNVLREARAIFVNGPPGSGKDTLCAFLYAELQKHAGAQEHNVIHPQYPYHMKFAQPIKAAVAATFGLRNAQEVLYYETEAKNKPAPKFYGKTPREVLISFSENWLKKDFGANIFGQLAVRRLVTVAEKHPHSVFLFSDSGFQAEFDAVRAVMQPQHMALIQLERAHTSFANDSRSYINPNDISFSTISNNESKTALRDKAVAYLDAFLA